MPIALASPTMYLRYAKLAGIVAVLAVLGAGVWYVRGVIADRDRQAAVEKAVSSIEKQLAAEQELRATYQQLVDSQIEVLLKSVSKLRGEFKTLNATIKEDVAQNPEVYATPLPPKGYESWKKARDTVQSSTQPQQP